MGAGITFFALVGLLVLFIYLKFPPPYADRKLVKTFNLMVLGVCAFFCLVWTLHIYSSMVHSNPEMWRPVALGGSLFIEIIFLTLCFVARNFWVFKPPRTGSGRSFFD